MAGGDIWKLGVRHGGKPLVAWKPAGNICKYSHPAFQILPLIAAYLCEWYSVQRVQIPTAQMEDDETKGKKGVPLLKSNTGHFIWTCSD